MSATLMTTRRFAPLFWCQFVQTFNENFLKTSVVFLALRQLSGAESKSLITLTTAALLFPVFIFSGLGGQLADRCDKAKVAQQLMLFAIGAAVCAAVGFWLHSISFLFLTLLLFGLISTLFGPVKAGILPELVSLSELPAANALLDGSIFIGILAGMIAGGLVAKDRTDELSFMIVLMVMAFASFMTARQIPSTGHAAHEVKVDANIARSTFALLRVLNADARLWWTCIVSSWFWALAVTVASLLPPVVKTVIGGDDNTVTAFLAVFSVAVGVGSALASWLAHGRIILFPTVVAAVLLGLFALDLAWTTWNVVAAHKVGLADAFKSPHALRIAADFAGLAVAGGLLFVPVSTAVLAWAEPDSRARVVAAIFVVNAVAMTVVSIAVALLQEAGVTMPMLFLAMGVANFPVAIALARTMPTRKRAPEPVARSAGDDTVG